jgi:phosphoglycolate phosphatase
MARGGAVSDIQGIVFDKDGTLFDFNATWAAWAADFLTDLSGGDPGMAARLGRAIGFDTAGRRFARDSVVIADTPDAVARALCRAMPGAEPAALVMRINAAAARAPMQPAVPLVPLLGRLRAMGLRLGVATNDAEAPALAHIEAAGAAALFDFIAGCDSGFGAKPEPGQLLGFADLMRIAPERIVMVGDSPHDLAAGRAAGMHTVGVLTGMASAAVLTPLADRVLPDIGHLPDWLADRHGPAVA